MTGRRTVPRADPVEALAWEFADAGVPLPDCEECKAYAVRRAWALLAVAAMMALVAGKRTGQLVAVHLVQFHHHGHVEGWWRESESESEGYGEAR